MKPCILRSPRFMRFAILWALLALGLQLLALEVGRLHMSERLAKAGALMEICTPAGMVLVSADGTLLPGEVTNQVVCPYCTATSHPPPLPVVAFAFFLPSSQASLPSSHTLNQATVTRPDRRHAPRAPPYLFA